VLVIDGCFWPFIQPYNLKPDGRAAWKAIMMQAEGVHGIITRKWQAYAMVSTARYTGKGRMTYDQYADRHQRAHNELESLGEPVAETKKVSDFPA
jgi:hypothetical protein